MDQQLWRRLRAAASLQGKPVNALLNEIIAAYLARQQG
jgi:hypothetical protein